MPDIWEWPRAHAVLWDEKKPDEGCAYDGDTFRCFVDLGRGVHWSRGTIRLAGIDTPEVRTSDPVEKAAGLAAKAYLCELLPLGTALHLVSVWYDKYNDRCDAVVIRKIDNLVVNDAMVLAGYARRID